MSGMKLQDVDGQMGILGHFYFSDFYQERSW